MGGSTVLSFDSLPVNTNTYLYFVSLGKSIPSRNPKVSNLSPGFPSDSVKHRPEGTVDDFTGTGSYANDKPFSNNPSLGTQKRTANRKGVCISQDLYCNFQGMDWVLKILINIKFSTSDNAILAF